MRAVLLARGLGSRMKRDADAASLTPSQAAAAAAGAKGMMPIGDDAARPFLDYVLSALADAGCTDVCLVVAPDHTAIRDYYDGVGRPARVSISYAVQEIANGTARAVQAAERCTGGEAFLVLNSDNLYPVEVLRSLVALDEPGLAAFSRASLEHDSGLALDRIASFAAIEVDRDGYLTRIVEKPGLDYYTSAGPGALVSMNVWRFDRRIFEACRDVPLSSRGEYELPEAVGLAVGRGVALRAIPAAGPVLDLSRRTDVAHVAARLAGVHPRP
jgi:glucose-1-phosphate thymidylyltransferase